MLDNEEVNKKIDFLVKKVKKKIYPISALKHRGLKIIKKILIGHAN